MIKMNFIKTIPPRATSDYNSRHFLAVDNNNAPARFLS
ncbi:hypothetical protein AZ044_000385 [Pluralibacter gergoviae]|nr:hypothetical protein AZ034_003032 [Pluralibacter gergoviae]OUF54152.1 hypothetical protein AZ044_000385 [Pluralibacter gergoviae]